jgi:predicted outer membrane protein
MTKFLLPAAFASAVLLAGCESPVAVSANGPANPADLAVVTQAQQVIMFNRALGKFAESDSERPEVRALAQDLVRQADALDAQLEPVTRQMNIRNPNVLRRDLRIRLGHVIYQHGLDFDETYLEDQVASHERALEELNKAVSATSAPLSPVATQSRDTIARSTERLKALQHEMTLSSR